MATATRDTLLDEKLPLLAALVAAEAVATVGYFLLTPAVALDPRYVIYPFVWINVGVLAVAHVDPPTDGSHRLAAAVASGYFLLLAAVTGLVGLYLGGHSDHSHSHLSGWTVTMTAPGWGPRVSYVTDLFHVYFVPYRVIGYLALAYLLYVAVRELSAAATSGIVGLASCLGCSFPFVTTVAAAVGGAGLATFVSTFSVDLSTALFVVAVGLLVWRPGES